MTKRYHLTILGYYTNSDTTEQTFIDCDGMSYSESGCYYFWVRTPQSYEPIAYYPIRSTIITSIESLKKETKL